MFNRKTINFDLVTVSFLKFPAKHRWYALTQMGRAHKWLASVDGCRFYKLMGSGAGKGFSILPNLSVYCLLMKWDDTTLKDKFFSEHHDWQEYKNHSIKNFRIELEATKVFGTWDGQQPFEMTGGKIDEGRIAVLTRATIKKRFIPFFWSKVPKASSPIQDIPGHLFSRGVGEVPLLHQATLSLWENKKAMHAYAYQHDAHVKMIKMTREKGWYAEELFAEFKVLNIEGEVWTF